MALDKIVIREITDEPLNTSVETIRSAFDTVARKFALTRENCPSNPAFVTEE